MSGSGQELEPAFKHDIFLFNGHGEDLTQNGEFEKITLPDNVVYITVTECGKPAQLASVDVLKSYRWRNPVFDIIPKINTPQYLEYKKELAQIFGMYDPSDKLDEEAILKILEPIHVKFPGEEINNNKFTPISTIGNPMTEAGYKKVKLDGASGLIKRDDWVSLDRSLIPSLTERKNVSELTAEDFLQYYAASSYPTRADVEAKLKENDDDVKKTIRYYYQNGTPVSELIEKFRSKIPERKTIFINPLCRVIAADSGLTLPEIALAKASSNAIEKEKLGGRRRRTYRRNKKLKRQTRRRR